MRNCLCGVKALSERYTSKQIKKRKGPGALKPDMSCILCHFTPLFLPGA